MEIYRICDQKGSWELESRSFKAWGGGQGSGVRDWLTLTRGQVTQDKNPLFSFLFFLKRIVY